MLTGHGLRAAWFSCVGALLSLLGGVGEAQAQQAPSLGWVRMPGAEGCIATHALAERVEARLGRRAFVSAAEGELSLEGRVAPGQQPNTWDATLVITNRAGKVLGRRELHAAGESCAVLDESLTLVIAIAIDPGSGLGVSAATQAPADAKLSPTTARLVEQMGLEEVDEATLLSELTIPGQAGETGTEAAPSEDQAGRKPGTAGSPAPPPRPPSPATKRENGRAADTAFELGAELGALAGPLPRIAWTGALVATIAPDRFWAVDMSLELALPRNASVATGDSQASLRMFAVGAGFCPARGRLGPLEARACLSARLGILSAQGLGFGAGNEHPAGVWADLLAYARILWSLGDFFVQASAGAGPALVRDTFLYEDREGNPQLLHRPAAVVGRAGLGAGVRFP